MEDLINLRADFKDLLLSQRFAVVSVNGKGYPNTGLVTYVYNPEEEKLYFAILKDNYLYNNLKSSPHVSLLIDKAQNTGVDMLNTQSISLLGKAQELFDYKKELQVVGFLERYACLSEFLHNEKCTIIEVNVHKYIFSSDLRDTITFDHF